MHSRGSRKTTAKGLLAAAALAALTLVAPVAEAAAAPVLEPTGSMATERYKAAAAPLPGGDALVAGGLHHVSLSSLESESLASAERYDGSTGTFSPTGSMAVSRMDPTAAPLPDGSVLVVGGQTWGGGGTPLASAEIYDPESGEFSATGSMAVTRFGAMAAPLPDGRVLVAGGYGSGEPNSAEIYDPESGEFSPTGSMVAGRGMGIAAPLPDGSVLIVAKGSGGNAVSTEIYDPLSGTFALGGAETPAPMVGAGGTRDDGSVLLFTEQRTGETTAKRTFEYDAATPALVAPSEAPTLSVERPAVAPLPGGRMLVAGGYSESPHAYGGQAIVPFAAIYGEAAARGGDAADTGSQDAASTLPASSLSGSSAAASQQASSPSPTKAKAKKLCKRLRAHGKLPHRCVRQAKGHSKPAP